MNSDGETKQERIYAYHAMGRIGTRVFIINNRVGGLMPGYAEENYHALDISLSRRLMYVYPFLCCVTSHHLQPPRKWMTSHTYQTCLHNNTLFSYILNGVKVRSSLSISQNSSSFEGNRIGRSWNVTIYKIDELCTTWAGTIALGCCPYYNINNLMRRLE